MAAPASIIWTIGHSNRPFEDFLLLLRAHNIQLLTDIRRFPGSRRHPQFSGEQLSAALEKEGIKYVHLPELGGRRRTRPDSPNTVWRNTAFRGYADYMMTEPFQRGLKRLVAIAGGERTALMCAEVLWWQCHRALISDYLKATGHSIIHILGPGKTQEHPFTSAAHISDGKLSYAPERTSQLHLETRA